MILFLLYTLLNFPCCIFASLGLISHLEVCLIIHHFKQPKLCIYFLGQRHSVISGPDI